MFTELCLKCQCAKKVSLVSLPADVLWGRNECVTNESQRVSAGRLGASGFCYRAADFCS